MGLHPLLTAGIGLAAMRIHTERPSFVGMTSFRVLFWTVGAMVITTSVFIVPSRWLSGVGGIALLIASVNFYGGRRFASQMVGPLLLVAAAIPLPVKLDHWFVLQLQQLATWLASVWLDLGNVYHLTAGAVIQTAGQEYLVKDACSGIHGVFAAFGVGVAYGVFRRYPVPRLGVFLVQLLFWVIVANALRVFLTVYGQEKWAFDLSDPAYHEALGVFTFVAGICLGLSGDHLIRYACPLRIQRSRSWLGQRTESEFYSLRWWDRPTPAFCVCVPAGIIALSSMAVGFGFFKYTGGPLSAMSMPELADSAVLDLQDLDAEFMPPQLADWTCVGFERKARGSESEFGGIVSLIWTYAKGTRSVQLSLDGPYVDWHDLSACYWVRGWDVVGMELTEADVERRSFSGCELGLNRRGFGSAHVLFNCVGPGGENVPPPQYVDGAEYLGATWPRVLRRFGFGLRDGPVLNGGVVQLQLLDQRAGAIDADAKAENFNLFRAAVQHVFVTKKQR